MLEQVDFCGLKVSHLIIGANPFGGYSHFSEERDAVMRIVNLLGYFATRKNINH